MCGIVGYVGKNHPKDILLTGLKALEYRGYDSSGIAIKNSSNLQIIKSVGKIKNLEEKIKSTSLIDANIGIAHTRWATHGIVNENNAHPHKVGKVTLVHNGIIENASVIKSKLIKKGIKFNSDTDTEVACALIDYYYKGNQIDAIKKAISELKGSYAFGIMFDNDNCLYAVRKGSPLIIGVGDNENFIASDLMAIVKYTNKYILLGEDEIAVLSNDVKIYKNGLEKKYNILTAKGEYDNTGKQGFDHYMLKEIMEEPLLLEKTLKPYIDDLSKLPDLKKYEEIHIVACGSAMYAGMIGKSLLEDYSIRVLCEVASEYRYKDVLYDRQTLVILVSQSGETADTIAAMRKAKEQNIDTLAIVNVKTSTIARESDRQIFIEAGPEVAVATTKAYILQVAIFGLLSFKVSGKKDLSDIKKLPKYVKKILNDRDKYLKIAKEIYEKNDIFFIGRKIDYAICLEGSLKLKEVSYIHSEAYQAGELKHGTISLINDGMPVFGIITDESIRDKTISNIEEVKSRGAKVIIISDKEVSGYDLQIVVPKISKFFESILIVPCLQLIAYETAKLRGCDIDKPKNLAKSVTVE